MADETPARNGDTYSKSLTMETVNFDEGLEQILSRDTRYHRDAYWFLRDALDYTHKMLGNTQKEGIRHVTGGQLLDGIRAHAAEQFGPMAMTVFAHWGVRNCEDWGEIVFIMIEHNVLQKNEQDSRDDFKGGYDFFETFRRPFLPANCAPTESLREAHSQA